MQVTKGSSDGVDLSGAKMFLQFELPGDFLSGIDKARVYVDPSTSDDQRREIDAIFHGDKGGLWGGLKEAIKEWLPTKVAAISFTDGDTPGAKLDGFGEIVLAPIKTEDGTQAKIVGAPLLAAFNMASEDLAYATGTKFSDPDMRSWESLGQGGTTVVEWSG
jgi:hypothetical protein